MSLNYSPGSRQANKKYLDSLKQINELQLQVMALDKKYKKYKEKINGINFWIKTQTNFEENHVQRNKLSKNMKILKNTINSTDKKITNLKEKIIRNQIKYNQKIASQKQKRIRTILPKSQMTKNLEYTKPTLNSIAKNKKNLLLKSKSKKTNKKLTPLFNNIYNN